MSAIRRSTTKQLSPNLKRKSQRLKRPMLQLFNLAMLISTKLLLAINSRKPYAVVSCWVIRMQMIFVMRFTMTENMLSSLVVAREKIRSGTGDIC